MITFIERVVEKNRWILTSRAHNPHQIHDEGSSFSSKGIKVQNDRENREEHVADPSVGVHDQFGYLSSNQTENLADKYTKQLCKRMFSLFAASRSHVAILTSSLLSSSPMFVR